MKKLILIAIMLCFSTVTQAKTVHVVVALCDNAYQRIYPVPPKLGNGSDPDNNLYWGAMYGVKGYLKSSKNWKLIEEQKNPEENILRRAIFKNKNGDLIVADAYEGKKIKNSIEDYLNFTTRKKVKKVSAEGFDLVIGGGADLLIFIGHNGLMDFNLKKYPQTSSNDIPSIVFCCYSRHYFKDKLGNSVLLTNGKMAPEGYILEAAVDSWIRGDQNHQIAENTGMAYSKYQKISNKAGINLFK